MFSEETFRVLFDASSEAMLIADWESSHFIHANRAAL